MAASLDTLPAELLDSIFDTLTTAELVGLWKSSKRLSNHLEDSLFGPNVLHKTMRWACSSGDVDLIRAAVSHGADPSVVQIEKQPPPARKNLERAQPIWAAKRAAIDAEPSPYKASTLAITARRRHEEAFDALLDLGAGLEGIACKHQRKALARALVKSRKWRLFRRLLGAGLGPAFLDDRIAQTSLVPFIKRDAPVYLLREMLEQGADPNLLVHDTSGDSAALASPLSAAIERGSVPVFDLLVENGADIQGSIRCLGFFEIPDKLFLYCRPKHLPIFAAAERMGRTGSMDMMHRCLRSGADINSMAPALFGHYVSKGYFAKTPLLAYLESIEKWPVENGLLPSAGIAYFLNHGAHIQRINHDERKIWPWLYESSGWWRDNRVPALSTIELLLYKWGLSKLHESQFFETIKYLVENGGTGGRERVILVAFSMDWKPKWTSWIWNWRRMDLDHPDYVPEWWVIVRLIIDKLQREHSGFCGWLVHTTKLDSKPRILIECKIEITQEDKDIILFEVLLERAGRPHFYSTLGRLITDRIQAEGADINGRVGPKGQTILFHWCHKLNQVYLDKSDDFRFSYAVNVMMVKSKEFCISLVNKGADPFLTVGDQTAVDVLLSGVESAQKVKKNYLVELAQSIRDERENFLQNGTTPNHLVQRTYIEHEQICDPQGHVGLIPPSPREERKTRRTLWLA
ncbi:Fc.00g071310.m01.CDS01 [Cosmosporella sp. VM-42]